MTTHTDMPRPHSGSRWRLAAWLAAALVLLAPLIAMRYTAEVDWSAGDFAFAGVLLFGSLGLYELTVRKTGNAAYRAGAALGLGALLLLLWANGAVGLTDSYADGLLFVGVPAVAFAGTFAARYRAAGMARAMLATAALVLLIGGGALLGGIVPEYNSAFEVLGLTGFFALLFAGSALLFRAAAREDSPPEA